jgi:hypothetical protein
MESPSSQIDVSARFPLRGRAGRTVVFALLIIFVCVAALLCRVSEPSVQGIPLGTFLDQPGAYKEGRDAVKHLGAQAVPFLVHVLENEPTAFQRWHGALWARLPPKGQSLAGLPADSNRRRARAAALLASAGTNAVAAIPRLIKTSQGDSFFGARHNALGTLSYLAPGSEYEERALLAAIERTKDADQQVCQHAYRSITRFTNSIRRLVPILMDGLKDPEVRDGALSGLRRLGKNVIPIVTEMVQQEGYVTMTIEALEEELTRK